MNVSSSWPVMEQAISHLLASAGQKRRCEVLARIAIYSCAAVREARLSMPVIPTAEERAATMAWLDRPVFICGHHRSGTTLLQQLLDSHPDIVVLPSEGTYFTSFTYAVRVAPTRPQIDRFAAEWISRFIGPNHPPHFLLGRAGPDGNPSVRFAQRIFTWHAAVRRCLPAYARYALLLALVASYRDVAAPRSEPRLWAEKTPLNELHVRRLAEFQEARFIQLVREPSATLASLRAGGNGRFDAGRHARQIARSLELASTNGRRYGERYLVVRYEDLTATPKSEMERVRSFLRISANASLLTPTVGGSAVRSNSSFEPSNPGEIRRSSGAPAASAVDETVIRAFAAPAASHFGYPVVKLPWLRRAAAYFAQLPGIVIRGVRA
jgi:hypothetical protein